MVADTPAHSQLPTELGVVHFGLASRTFFFKDPLHALEEENTKAVSSAIKFFSHTSCKLLCCTQGSQNFPGGAKEEKTLNSFG